MCMEIVRRVGGVRLLLKRPFLEPMNEGEYEEAHGEGREEGRRDQRR